MIKRPALRYHGGKFRIAPWVIEHFPPHRTYVEPFGGAAGVLLQKPRAYSEVYNDLDADVVNFFRVLRDPAQLDRLLQACAATPYARAEFEEAWEPVDEPVERARRLTIRAQMGFGSAGATKGTTGFRIDTKREYETAQHLWAMYPDAIANAGQRLAAVLIENRPAIAVMAQHDDPETLHFVDPPYVHSTRVMQAGKAGYYRHEMTDEQHVELLDFLNTLTGMIVLSGYRSELYDSRLRGWTRDETQARASAGRGGVARTEVLWLNDAAIARQNQQRLFA
ncbi:MAG: putative n6 adenine-specific dna methyltransferase protein [Gammaproteobacteria bacterium]|nr:putative n6 adenine-specific dna methyltransferase protein [Gammaproteobacteria bacterium]